MKTHPEKTHRHDCGSGALLPFYFAVPTLAFVACMSLAAAALVIAGPGILSGAALAGAGAALVPAVGAGVAWSLLAFVRRLPPSADPEPPGGKEGS